MTPARDFVCTERGKKGSTVLVAFRFASGHVVYLR